MHMDRDTLQSLIAAGESLAVEFKGERRCALNDRDLVEVVVCLANAEGGVLLVGVEDDGLITGARPRHGAAHRTGQGASADQEPDGSWHRD